VHEQAVGNSHVFLQVDVHHSFFNIGQACVISKIFADSVFRKYHLLRLYQITALTYHYNPRIDVADN
jgi:hypothetical protein